MKISFRCLRREEYKFDEYLGVSRYESSGLWVDNIRIHVNFNTRFDKVKALFMNINNKHELKR